MASPRPVLFVGSSIFEQWTRSGDAVDGPSVNEAIGGTTSRDWVPLLPALLHKHRPRLVVCYAGSNDFNNAIPASKTKANVLRLAEMTAARCRFVYTSIIKSPAKRGHWDYLGDLHAHWRSHLPAGSGWMEINPMFFDAAGEPRDELYIEDQLHLTPGAYDELTAFARPLLAAELEAAR